MQITSDSPSCTTEAQVSHLRLPCNPLAAPEPFSLDSLDTFAVDSVA